MIDMNYMFYSAEVFNQDVSSWNVSKVKLFSYMFKYVEKFNKNLKKWTPDSMEDIYEMFTGTSVSCSTVKEMMKAWQLGIF